MNISLSNIGIILENKVVQTLKLENNVFAKKWSPKLIFLHKKNLSNLTSKINFESMILAIFDKPSFFNGFFFL